MKRLSVIISIVIILGSCVKDPVLTTGNIEGVVTHFQTRQTLAGVEIQIEKGANFTTVDNGRFVFTDLAAGTHTLSFVKNGYPTIIREVHVGNGQTVSCDVAFDFYSDFRVENGVLSAYYGNSATVLIPEGITGIGESVFAQKNFISSVIIPEGVTAIGMNAFMDCISLTSVTLPATLLSIGTGSFRYCLNLNDINIPQGLMNIGDFAFAGCDITTITIPASIIGIGKHALSSLMLTDIIVDTGNNYFSSENGILFNKDKTMLIQCPYKKEVAYTIPESVIHIGENAFLNCSGLSSVIIPNSVTNIGRQAFSHCNNLVSVSFGSGVLIIGTGAFSASTALTSVVFPNSLLVIGESAFEGCTGLTSVAIPNSVVHIGDNAFLSNSNLTSVSIGSELMRIGDFAFADCQRLTTITVDAQNAHFIAEDNVLFNKAMDVLILCPGGRTGAYAIPGSVTRIERTAFYGCRNLTSITIPGSVIEIGEDAFRWCLSLTSLTVGWRNPPTLSNTTFGNTPVSTAVTLNVLVDREAEYRQAPVWRDFRNIVGNVEALPSVNISDYLAISDGLYFWFSPLYDTKTYYWRRYLSNSLPDYETIIEDIVSNGVKMDIDGNNEGLSWNLSESTKYTICIIAYDSQNRPGELVKREFTTKSSSNQPLVDIKINSILDDRVYFDYTMNSNCVKYVDNVYRNQGVSQMNRYDIDWAARIYKTGYVETIDYNNASYSLTPNSNYYALVTMGFDVYGNNSGIINKVFFCTDTKSIIEPGSIVQTAFGNGGLKDGQDGAAEKPTMLVEGMIKVGE